MKSGMIPMIGTNSMEDKIMKIKKITFAILAIAFIAAFNSCKEEEEIQIDDEEDDWEYVVKQYDETTPHTPGTFVMFGANTYFKNGEEDTRTKYAEYPGEVISVNQKKYERIDWINGDMIQVFCEQSPTTPKHAVYDINALTIKPNENDKRQSVAAVTLHSGETGLRWGDESTTHIFQAIYPKPGSITYEGSNNWPRVYDPDDQYSLKFITAVPGQQDYEDNIEKMSLAGMVAKTTVSPGETGNVTLVFYPIVTTLQFDLVNTTNKKISIDRVYIDGVNGEPDISGTYDVAVPAAKQTISGSGPWTENPDIVFSGFSEGKGTVSVAIPYGKKDLAVNDQLRVVMYALPLPEGEFTNAKLAIEMDIYEDGEDADPIHITRRVALNKPKDTNANEKEYIVFKPTHKYNFVINIPSSTVFKVTPREEGFGVPGGECAITVTSYKTNYLTGVKEPVAWTATEYSIDGGEWTAFNDDILAADQYGIRPTLLKGWEKYNNLDENSNPKSPLTFNAIVARNIPKYEKLRATHLPDNQVIDLSKYHDGSYIQNEDGSWRYDVGQEGSRNTANCYMVHASGTYKFPIVYGNAIKNGETNESAFKPYYIDRTGGAPGTEMVDSLAYTPEAGDDNLGWNHENQISSHFLSPFVDYQGNDITIPQITGASSATLVWQDANGLIEKNSIAITSGEDRLNYVTFKVSEDKLTEGNALIAVVDESGTIMWSWHIWVTEMTKDDDIITSSSTIMGKKLIDYAIAERTNYHIAGFVGFCDLSVGPKNITVKFVQDGTGDIQYVTLTQSGRFDGNAPLYQFGRKDPLQSQQNLYEDEGRWVDKQFYDIAGNPVSLIPDGSNGPKVITGRGKSAISKCIQNPLIFCMTNSVATANPNSSRISSMDDIYFNLWAAHNTRIGMNDQVLKNGTARIDKTKTIYDPCPVGYRVPSFEEVEPWRFKVNYSEYQNLLINKYYYYYTVLNLKDNGVCVPSIAGKVYNYGYYYSNLRDWAKWEMASWVSNPNCYSIVSSTTHGPRNPLVDNGKNYYTGNHIPEAVYWRHVTDCLPRWDVAGQTCYQIRFNAKSSWMNHDGATKGNAVNVFMVKETGSDSYHTDYANNQVTSED